MDGTHVSVMALFHQGKLVPKAFRQGGRTIMLDHVTLAYRTRADGPEQWYFTMAAPEGVFTLVYNPKTTVWQLVASWEANDQSNIEMHEDLHENR